MNRKRGLAQMICLTLACLFLSACSTAQPRPAPTTPTPTASAVPSPTASAVSPPTDTQVPPPSGGDVIAFASERTGNWEIYVINADGSGLRQLTENDAGDWSPAWSPDGTHIAFISNRDGNDEIYIMDANGSDQRRLTSNSDYDWSPAWSPDGEWIVFTSNRDGNDEIYVMPAPYRDGAPGAQAPWPAGASQGGQVPADGSDQRRLTSSNSVQEVDPDWSPDGERIVFTSDRDGDDEIYVMNADGSNQRQLTDDDTTNWWPAWSPDGTKIAFASNRDGNWDIYVMPAPYRDGAPGAQAPWPAGASQGGQVDSDGNNQQRLTEDAGRDWWPVWSPDGTRIAFHSDAGGNWDIYVMPAPYRDGAPGTQAPWPAGASQGGQVDADGKGRRQLTTSAAADQYPAWRPDIVNLE